MKPGGGSQKGSSFEREVCKKLSLWVSNGEKDDIFWRTAGSGARATTRAKGGKSTCNADGDMCCLDPAYQWFIDSVLIEMKRGYNSWRLDDFLLPKQKKDSIFVVWEKLEKEAAQLHKLPLLILKQDRRQELYISQSYFQTDKSVCLMHRYKFPVYIHPYPFHLYNITGFKNFLARLGYLNGVETPKFKRTSPR